MFRPRILIHIHLGRVPTIRWLLRHIIPHYHHRLKHQNVLWSLTSHLQKRPTGCASVKWNGLYHATALAGVSSTLEYLKLEPCWVMCKGNYLEIPEFIMLDMTRRPTERCSISRMGEWASERVPSITRASLLSDTMIILVWMSVSGRLINIDDC